MVYNTWFASGEVTGCTKKTRAYLVVRPRSTVVYEISAVAARQHVVDGDGARPSSSAPFIFSMASAGGGVVGEGHEAEAAARPVHDR